MPIILQISFESISAFLTAYPYVLPGIIAVLGWFISFILGRYSYKRQLDTDAFREHFKEIKKDVLAPILHIYKNNSIDLPAIEQLMTNGLTVEVSEVVGHFDAILFEDFLNNHYSWVRKNWTEVNELQDKVAETDNEITALISNQACVQLEAKKIRFVEKDSDIKDGKFEDILYLNAFTTGLKSLIMPNQYADEKVCHTTGGEAQNIIVGYGVSYVSKASKPEVVVNNLREICRPINTNDNIQKAVADHNRLVKSRAEKRKKLISDLNIVFRRTRLNLEKRKFFLIKCPFIKPN